MKKLLFSIFLLSTSASAYCQTDEESKALTFVFSKINKYATRVDLFKSPGQYVLQDPRSDFWGETINFQTSENAISIPMNRISKATVEPYGIELTGPSGQATIFMDLASDVLLRADLQHALTYYVASRRVKEYTVYQKIN